MKLPALDLLFEDPDLPRFGLPSPLASAYGGDFGIARPRVFTNFVSSVDGVVALRDAGESGAIISGGSEADRFVMALLRACADAVLIGAGTLRRAPGDLWLPGHVFPAGSELFDALRTDLGLRPQPRFVVVTASGQIDTSQPALRDALIATTPAGEATLRGSVPEGARVVAFDSDRVRPAALLEFLRKEGLERVLAEGGPSLVGELVRDDLVDEMFLTVSPKLFGRTPGDGRKTLLHEVDVAGRDLALLSARRHESHLFLRYGLSPGAKRPLTRS